MKVRESRVFRIFEVLKGKKKLILTQAYTDDCFFNEDFVRDQGKNYRVLDPMRSKLGAAIMKNSPNIGFREGDHVLYLGASHGYTPSYVSDIVGKNGFVYALDFAPRVVRDLVFLCEKRDNMAPMMFDANHPEEYKEKVISPVDVVYMDIAQRDQAEIFLKNVDLFLKKGGYCLVAIKARSIDVTERPSKIFEDVRRKLDERLVVIDSRKLDPFEKDHMMFICKKN